MNTGLSVPTAAPRDESARKYFREVMDGKNLPSLPIVANTVLKMVQDPDCNIEKLRRVLADDTSLAARVLAISRSPQYGQRNLPTSLLGALQVLGFRMLGSVVVSSATQSLCLKGNKTSEQLWNHSLAVALAMRILSKRAGLRDSELAFLAGLMHDVGQMILLNGDPVEYAKLVTEESPEQTPILDREQAAYGLDHCVMGFTLLNHWNMDEHLVQAVFNHHSDLSDDADNELADLLTLADYLCWKGDLGFFTEPALPSARVLARCGWDGTSSTDEVVELILEAYRAESLLFASA